MYNTVAIGVKPGAGSEDALMDAARQVAAEGATIHLVSFITIGVDEDELQRIQLTERALEALASEQDGFSTMVHVQVTPSATAGSDLVRFVEEEGVDLLIVGVTKRSRVGKALLGSAAQTAILTSPCPVLSVRGG